MKNASPYFTVPSFNRYFLKKVNKDCLNIRTDNWSNNILSNLILLDNKQPLNLQQLHIRSKNTFHNEINHVTNNDVKFAHIFLPIAA